MSPSFESTANDPRRNLKTKTKLVCAIWNTSRARRRPKGRRKAERARKAPQNRFNLRRKRAALNRPLHGLRARLFEKAELGKLEVTIFDLHRLNQNPLHFIERDLIAAPVIEAGSLTPQAPEIRSSVRL
jgi:hypothetical protein